MRSRLPTSGNKRATIGYPGPYITVPNETPESHLDLGTSNSAIILTGHKVPAE